ncbi:MAG: right-handed parallel beta-helix repeat-containing protein [Anaerolineae bacterium]|nr:right-handed parallel beta-helix repeat-containing protein [Anaerolineae bacterium]
MSHVFISYSRTDVDAANAFAALLRTSGHSVFIDYQSIAPGEDFPERLAREIEKSDMLLYLVSAASVDSRWVKSEVQYAFNHRKQIIVVRLDLTPLPRTLFFLTMTDYVEATYWNTSSTLRPETVEKLSRALSLTPNPAPAPPSPSPATKPGLVVARIGPADFRSIGDAIKKAPEGSTIYVKPGLYRESITLNKPVELIGDGPREDIVIEVTQGNCLRMSTDYAIVRGLTLRQRSGAEAENTAVYVPQGRLVLEDCDLTSDSVACLETKGGGSDPIVRRCRIFNGNQGGIFVHEYGRGTYEDCQVFGNGLAGIEAKVNANPVIRRCQIYDNRGSGIFVHTEGAGSFEDCEIHANLFHGVNIRNQGNPTLRGCTITRNEEYGVRAHDGAKGTVTNCDLRDNGWGTWHIDDSSNVTRRDNQE